LNRQAPGYFCRSPCDQDSPRPFPPRLLRMLPDADPTTWKSQLSQLLILHTWTWWRWWSGLWVSALAFSYQSVSWGYLRSAI
jgi:hypothetical protein